MKTFASLFSGGGGVDIGAMAAGLTPLWAVEYDEEIAEVYRQNIGDHIVVANMLDLVPSDFGHVDVLHASPPCPNFSTAKAGAEETENDINLAKKVAQFIDVIRPKVFTLENVYQYRKSKSWLIIQQQLVKLGYHVSWWKINMANYGVPQTRKRIIVVASRVKRIPKPPATHQKPDDENQLSLFGRLPYWVSWYEAIEDLIPTLPDGKFADWQMKRLPDEYKTFLIGDGDNYRPAVGDDKPSPTVGASNGAKAFLLSTQTKGTIGDVNIAERNRPSFTMTGSKVGILNAFIVDGKLGFESNGKKPLHINNGVERFNTVVSSPSEMDSRVFIVRGANSGSNGRVYHNDNETAHGVDTGTSINDTGFVGGRVVKMTVRCLARFQSFLDWYTFPEKKKTACMVVGNAVPPLFAQRLYEHILRMVKQ